MNLSLETSLPAAAVFLQGLLSFFSPCVLPLVPLYIGYLAGGTGVADENGVVHYPRKKVLLNTLCFVIGVSFAFFLLGFGFTAAGRFFGSNRNLFARIGGIIVILFGVYQLGILGSSRLIQEERRLPFRLQNLAMNPLVALVMGFTFSFAWTPCVGPALTGVLLMASSAQQSATGYALIGVYTLGFVLPFLAVGLFTGQLLELFKKYRNLLRYTVKAGGALMILMGIMMYTGWMNNITGYLSQFGAAPPSAPSSQPAPPTAPNPNSSPESGSLPEQSPPPAENASVPAPDFTLVDQYGNSHTLSDYKGKVVFLNFWATWCGYCEKEMPDIQKLYEKYSGDDSEVVVLGIIADIAPDALSDYLTKGGYSYPNLLDSNGQVFATYGVSALPTTFMIDKDGNVFGYLSGMMTAAMMQDIVDQTLNSGGASASSATPEPPPSLPASTTVGEGNLYIQQLAAETISKLELSGKDSFRQVQSVYEHLIANTTFAPPVGLDSWQLHQGVQPDYLENRALSPLAYGIGSCEDYAAAMVVLLRELGFEARYVPGITISVGGDFVDHAWAAVQIQGNWYHLDPQLEDNIMKNSLLRYRYFLKTDKEMLVDHRWGKDLLEYAKLTKEQQQEVEKNYLIPPCKREYPAVTPAKLASPPPPNIGAITAQIAAERAAYEAAHGKLPPVTLNITPPVFGNAGYGPPD